LVASAGPVIFSGLDGHGDLVLEMPFPCRVGEDVVSQSIWESRRQDRGWWKSREWRALLMAMLTELHGVSADAVLCLGLPTSWYIADKDEVRGALIGEHVVKRGGRDKQKFNLVDVRVLPQGLGLLMDVVLDDNGQVVNKDVFESRVGVINIGSNNTNYLDVQRLRVGSASWSSDIGSWKAAESLKRVLAVKAPTLRLSDYEIDNLLRADGVAVGGGKWLDLRVEIAEIKADFARAVLAEASQGWGSGDQFRAILVGGGSAYHVGDAVGKVYAHAALHGRPVNGDAWGQWKFSKRVAGVAK